MDYPAWELERQRRALAALLSGGGEREEDRRERRRRDGGADARRQGGETGDGGTESGGETGDASVPGAWEAVRKASRDRASGSGEAARPWSVWERIQDAESGGAPAEWGRSGEDAGEMAAADRGRADGPEAEESPGGRKGRRAPEKGRREAPGDRSFEAAEAAEFADRGGGEAFPGWGNGGDWKVPGKRTDWGGAVAGRTARRRGGGLTGTADGTGFWGGGWGSAALREEEGAKALSRAVQRDARRYDGGFSLY